MVSGATLRSTGLVIFVAFSSNEMVVSSFKPMQQHMTRPRASKVAQRRLSSIDEWASEMSWLTRFKADPPTSTGTLLDDERAPLTASEFATKTAPILESIGRYAIGLGCTIGVIYMLAMLGDGSADVVAEPGSIVDDELSKLARNVYVAAMPEDANDLVAIALGEGIGAVIGSLATAIVTALVGAALRLRMTAAKAKRSGINVASTEEILAEAVADTEYFWTKTGAVPLLRALGINPAIARLSSVALATVPYELVKWQARKEKQLQAENALMDELLLEQQKEERMIFTMRSKKNKSVDPLKLQAIEKRPIIDVPEIFSDVIKWLEYDVLKTDFGGQLILNGQTLGSGAESFAFGVIIALSSQLYLDMIYRYTDFGPDQTTNETRTRSAADWTYLYINRCLGTATLFGVYESVSLPVSIAIQGLLAGAVDGCTGSNDFRVCVETFVADNPPEASPEAQFRALVIALVSLFNRIQSEGVSDAPELIRAVVLQTYTVATQFMQLMQP